MIPQERIFSVDFVINRTSFRILLPVMLHALRSNSGTSYCINH